MEEKKKINIKIIIPIVFAIVVIAIVGAILTQTMNNNTKETVSNNENQTVKEEIKEESKYIKVNNIYIDNSFEDDNLNLVYLFYTVNSGEENLKVSSKDIDLTINDTNKYSCTMKSNYNPNYTDYCYSEFLKDIYVGSTLKVCATYQIPKGDLAPNRIITLSSSKFSDISNLKINTNDIKTLENTQEIAKDLDINVYNANYEARQDADTETINKVKNQINGYELSFYPTLGTKISSGKIEFDSPNKFKVTVAGLLTNSGNYSIKKNYIILTYTSGGNIELEYNFNDSGEINFPTLGGTGTFSSYVDYENHK